jgi:amino acid adenylation domain-containing protein
VFVSEKGQPLQVVSEPGPWELPVMDLSGSPVAREKVREQLRADISRGFDLARGPLFRAHLYRLAPDAHVLLLAMHHIVSDGWSMAVFTRELCELYRRFCRGGDARLPALRVQYRDYARWQRGWLQGEVLERELAHWRGRLAGAPQVLELATDRMRPAVESHRGAFHAFALPRELVERLHGLSRREGATLFMTLLSGFALLLSRYGGQQDLLIGTPVANRSRAEIEGLIGFFVNTLVLRADLSGEPSVREFLARMREVCLEAYAHQDLPFERLVEELKPVRDLSRNPVFQVMFILQNAPQSALELPGLTLKFMDVGTGTAKVDLTLQAQETPEGLSGVFEYATDLFEPSTIARLAAHWRALLEAMVAAPERRVSQLPLLTEPERRRLLVEWADTGAGYGRGSCVQEMFEAQAARTPDAVALVCGGERLSYRELDARASRIAHVLRARGVGRGQRVGLCVERGADMVASVLGILKSGAAYVPLDPWFPPERLQFMAQDAELALLVSTGEVARLFDLPRERQLLLDADAGVIGSAPAAALPPDARSAQPGDAAYVIYTSGSTGKPKGVVVPHGAVVNFLASMAREPGLSADDVLLAVTTLSFDIAVLELQLPLTLGATVVVATRDEALDGRALGALLEEHRATVMQATPATWRLLLEAGWRGGSGFKALVGGEALPRDLADQLITRGVELWNLYGPTETTVWSSCARITDTSGGITIGKPIANTVIRILDAHNGLCPIGVPGELCIGGEGVSLGYWRRPELTAERFIADPFGTTPGARLYKTGDRARWREDGTLEHLGRLDFQVKLRGYRIELGEIEATLAGHPAVQQAVVVAREDEPGEKRLVAYVVAQDAPAELVERLRAHLRAKLPEYMVPSALMVLDAMPLTPNGKIDRKALPAPQRAGLQEAYVAPRTATEETVMVVFREVLGRNDFGITDNFFDLGGHSLMAARLMHRLRAVSGILLPLRNLFERPTVVGLAETMDRLSWWANLKAPASGTADREEIEL